MRTFIAIELPKEIKEYLAKLQQELKTAQADVKWVEPDNIHLTLKFLGEIDDTLLEKITAIINDVANKISAFKLRINSLGAFPKIDSPRVIWVGVDAGDKEVKEIAGKLEEEIAKIGIPKEDRPFSSHITIGRTKSGLNQQKLVQVLKDKFDLGGKNPEFSASKITLFKSTLSPKGPAYEILKEADLKTT
jgi:RNA 2',3'-cyclic 3'-phosphodiesterase